ncbi:MAG: hypothetical protein RKE49_14950 [Oceanicaulis sp.]
MTGPVQTFAATLPAEVSERLYRDYPTYRATVTILDALDGVAGLSMRAGLARTSEHPEPHPVLDFLIDDGRLFLFRLNCPERMFLRFTTRTDLQRFLELGRPYGAVSGKDLAADPRGWPVHFEMMTAFKAREIDYDTIARALTETLRRSPVWRGVHRPQDTALETLLRDIHKPQDEMVFDEMIEQILDQITEDNFDTVMETLGEYDPMALEDPGSVPGMRLILMGDLVRERGLFLDRSLAWLPSVLAAFEAIEGGRARADVAETAHLIAHIEERLGGAG